MSKSLHIPGPKGDSLNQNSGLKYFGSAKKKINAIFSNVQQYLGSFNNLLTKMQDELNFPPEQQMYSKVTESHAQITNIQEVLQRDKMKVVFFGKTSAGKVWFRTYSVLKLTKLFPLRLPKRFIKCVLAKGFKIIVQNIY